jgi:hypothetical protein
MTTRLETVGGKAHNLTARSGDRTVAAPTTTFSSRKKKGEG